MSNPRKAERPQLSIGIALLLVSALLGAWALGGARTATGAPVDTSVRQAAPEPAVGLEVGQRAPDFTVTTLDAQALTSADLLAQDKPFILYFFTTWCTTCRAEFRLLKDLYPGYAERVNFVAVGIDPTEGPDIVAAYHQAMGYPWTVTLAERDVLERYNVISTAIKYAIDRHGIITFQRGYGVNSSETWTRVFEDLLQR